MKKVMSILSKLHTILIMRNMRNLRNLRKNKKYNVIQSEYKYYRLAYIFRQDEGD